MYEFPNGALRLTEALWLRIDDPFFREQLAEMLDYQEEQLAEDVRALDDMAEGFRSPQ